MAGTLKLSGTEVVSEEEKPKPPVTPSMSTEARQTTVDAVKIDGKADEKDVWDQVEWSDPAVAYKKQPIATEGSDAYQESYGKFGFRFKTLWATDGKKAYVYFLIDVSDSNLTSTKRAWASDNVRIFLDETGTAAEGTLASSIARAPTPPASLCPMQRWKIRSATNTVPKRRRTAPDMWSRCSTRSPIRSWHRRVRK